MTPARPAHDLVHGGIINAEGERQGRNPVIVARLSHP